MEAKFADVWPAMLTPLTEEGKPSFGALEQLTDLFVKQELGGLYITGSTGQWPLFTTDERRTIAECIIHAAAGRIPVIVPSAAMNCGDRAREQRRGQEKGRLHRSGACSFRLRRASAT